MICIAYKNDCKYFPVFGMFDDAFRIQEKAFFIGLVLEEQCQAPARLFAGFAKKWYNASIMLKQ
jgi:hypothetical protein